MEDEAKRSVLMLPTTKKRPGIAIPGRLTYYLLRMSNRAYRDHLSTSLSTSSRVLPNFF